MTTSMVGLKNGHIRKYLPKNGELQRYSWEHRKRIKPFIVCYKTDILVSVLVVWYQGTVLQATASTCFCVVYPGKSETKTRTELFWTVDVGRWLGGWWAGGCVVNQCENML